jgi:tetratricopeptide (TPR) repeat protein
MFRILRALVGAVTLALCAGPAFAQTWLKAESEHFIVYSDGGERALRDYVVKLERFDQILRLRFGVPLDEPTLRKLPIYLVARQAGLEAVAPGIGRGVAGFYTTNEEDVFAVAIRNDGDETVLHEYAHHFFYQHLNAPYPGWLSEGLAEYVMTARIRDDDFVLGEPNEGRVSWLNYGAWIPLDMLLSKRFGQIESGEYRGTYYSVAWLLTHWFFSTPERSRQLDAYLRLVASGVGPSDAIVQATGMSMVQLTQTLTTYGRGNVYSSTYPIEYRPIEVEITRMPASARDLILLGQRIKRGQTEERRQEALAEIRTRAGRWPDDAFAQLILGHAELHIGDPAVGEATLLRVLELDPENDEALQFLATGRIRQADDVEDPEQRRSLLAQARGFLARAYRIDPDDYFTLLLIARTREGQPGYPNENDMMTWEAAFDGAPQLAEVRLGYGAALIADGRVGEALGILTPLANSPHGGTAADAARALVAHALGEAPPPAEAEPEPETGPAAADQAG